MFLSNWRKKKEFKRNIIYGDQLIERWDIDIHQLSYIILKQDLSVLNLPNKLRLHNIFEPNYYKIEQDELIEIIYFKPKSLSDKAFWIPEIKKANNYFKSLTEKYKKETEAEKHKKEADETFDHTLSGKHNNEAHETSDHSNQIQYSLWGHCWDDSKEKEDKSLTQLFKHKRKERENGSQQIRYMSLERENPVPQVKKRPERNLKDIIEEHESDIKKNPNVFSLIGKVWFVKFKNNEWGLFPDLEKYKYIACLLELTKSYSHSQEYSIYNSELMAKIKGSDDSNENDNENLKKDLNESDLGDSLTYEDFKRFKDIGYNLLEKLNESKQSDDPIEEKEAEENFKSYQSYILNDYGIKSQISKDGLKINFGTYHRSSKESEKLRQLIKNQIKNAIKDFKKSLPMLGLHLQISLSTKFNKTLYTPQGIQWQV